MNITFWILLTVILIIGSVIYAGIGFIIALTVESLGEDEESFDFSERLAVVLLWPKVVVYYIRSGYDELGEE